ncbi:hypothetical protein Scep_013047 [Stephania cephalantha]|uniref:t-SNARE coiled-coil homology domain-containing protein n=1 Tax=Stephania cephalantha TaxID=152367 RepID=A0AAP0JGL1_9MAGN
MQTISMRFVSVLRVYGPLQDSFVKGSREQLSEMSIEMGIPVPPTQTDMAMESFSKKVQEIEKQMDKLNQLLQKLQDANEESRTTTRASKMKEIKQRMGKDIDEVGKIARNIKLILDEIDKDVLRQNIQDEYREIVERRIFTVTGTKPDDEMVDHLIETGNSEEIFHKAIQETGKGQFLPPVILVPWVQVLDTLKEIQERHDAVKEIEKKLLDLHQIFLDMAVLVEAQGDFLDNIEIQVTNAVEHVHSGNDALRTAKSLQKKSRKCMMIAITILLIIAIIIVLSILKPWKK